MRPEAPCRLCDWLVSLLAALVGSRVCGGISVGHLLQSSPPLVTAEVRAVIDAGKILVHAREACKACQTHRLAPGLPPWLNV